MIARIEGQLVDLNEETAWIQVGPICYEVMLPGYVVAALTGRIGQEITLCTLEYYEGTPGGGNLIPRLVGFLSVEERTFFHHFTSVKGLGIKKGLRALAMPVADIAAAIESGDEKLLTALPTIGKRMAQQIVAALQGKVQGYALDRPARAEQPPMQPYQIETLEILVAWGEKRTEAADLVELACRRHPDVRSAEELVPLVYRIKQGIEA